MKSMTAYASLHKNKNSQFVQINLRSTNYKYLDVSIRNLPAEDILLEEKIKREIKKKIHRGKIEVFIFLAKPQAKKIYINDKTVSRYVSQIKALAKKHHLKPEVNISDILNLPQTISWGPQTRSDEMLVLPIFKEALDKLLAFKKKEGEVIKKEVINNLRKLKNNIAKIKKQKPKISGMENGREDIDEELSLITFYIAKLESKINAKKLAPQGKSIDFLTQEILRELNAASSKTKKKGPALLIVEAKNYLERIREQAQNIE